MPGILTSEEFGKKKKEKKTLPWTTDFFLQKIGKFVDK
jgi:hypothetical protein